MVVCEAFGPDDIFASQVSLGAMNGALKHDRKHFEQESDGPGEVKDKQQRAAKRSVPACL